MRSKRKRSGDEARESTDSTASRHAPSPDDALPFQDFRLKLLVFWAGAVLMGLEIAGSRVLAPHFGNSVFVWGSLITVFLAALSGGNYLGGWLADLRPSPGLLSGICIAVAVWIGGLSLVASGCCQIVAQLGLGEEIGPMVASLVLFLPPSVGMGIVSPFAVRLSASTISGVGRVSGSLYALSTVGSIVGTIATTFVLIPSIGLAAILRGLGVTLLLAALASFPSWRGSSGITGAVMLGLLAMLPLQSGGGGLTLRPSEQIVAEYGTPYHNIAVIDDLEHHTRQLRFDRFVESAILLDPPYPSLADYTHYFHLAFLVRPKIERTLFIGAGGGIGPRTFHAHSSKMLIDVVDIDPVVLQLAQTHFFLNDEPTTRFLFAADGRMFVRSSPESYDCIVLDAFSIGGRIPFHLATADFFRLCRARLTPDGVFIMNINSAVDGPSSRIFHSIHKTLAGEFPQTYAFAHELAERGRNESTNILLVGTTDGKRLSLADWQARATAYRSKSYVSQPLMRQLVENLIEDLPDMSAAPILTDDFAPIETMAF